MENIEVIHSEALYGAKTKQPLVKISWGKKSMTCTTNDAKRMAYDLLDTAHASDGDAFIFNWLLNELGLPLDKAAGVLVLFRDYRVRTNGEQ